MLSNTKRCLKQDICANSQLEDDLPPAKRRKIDTRAKTNDTNSSKLNENSLNDNNDNNDSSSNNDNKNDNKDMFMDDSKEHKEKLDAKNIFYKQIVYRASRVNDKYQATNIPMNINERENDIDIEKDNSRFNGELIESDSCVIQDYICDQSLVNQESIKDTRDNKASDFCDKNENDNNDEEEDEDEDDDYNATIFDMFAKKSWNGKKDDDNDNDEYDEYDDDDDDDDEDFEEYMKQENGDQIIGIIAKKKEFDKERNEMSDMYLVKWKSQDKPIWMFHDDYKLCDNPMADEAIASFEDELDDELNGWID